MEMIINKDITLNLVCHHNRVIDHHHQPKQAHPEGDFAAHVLRSQCLEALELSLE